MNNNENLGLNLAAAINTPIYYRVKDRQLIVGYDVESGIWELVIRYSGNLERLSEEYAFAYDELLGGYAVIYIEGKTLTQLIKSNEIKYIDKGSVITLEDYDEKICKDVCIKYTNAITGNVKMFGSGVYIAVIDSGIDIYNDIFIEDNKTKIYRLWDQSIDGSPPNGYSRGTEYDENEINKYITSGRNNSDFKSFDASGHGTAVAAIAISCAYGAKLVIVKLDRRKGNENTVGLLEALDYCFNLSIQENVPIAINLSYGTNYGDHDGNTILEQYIDAVSGLARCGIAVGSGNDGDSSKHAKVNIMPRANGECKFLVGAGIESLNIQLWRDNNPNLLVYLIVPGKEKIGPLNYFQPYSQYYIDKEVIISTLNGPSPINRRYGMFVSIIGDGKNIAEGEYIFRFENEERISTKIDLWLPVEGELSGKVFFTEPSLDISLTIPSTARRVVTVGAYDYISNTYASFSGRGYTLSGEIKPDVVAPGVDVLSVDLFGNYAYFTGTSFAVPYVTGEIARSLAYGIVDGNDLFLYGERIKAEIIGNTTPLYGIEKYPDEKVGWGAFCINQYT